jgi:hypothetical protein
VSTGRNAGLIECEQVHCPRAMLFSQGDRFAEGNDSSGGIPMKLRSLFLGIILASLPMSPETAQQLDSTCNDGANLAVEASEIGRSRPYRST